MQKQGLSKNYSCHKHPEKESTDESIFTIQFAYYLLIWMFHNRKLKNKINKLHERSLR